MDIFLKLNGTCCIPYETPFKFKSHKEKADFEHNTLYVPFSFTLLQGL